MKTAKTQFAMATIGLATLFTCGAITAGATQPDGCTAKPNDPNSTIQKAVDRGCSHIRVLPGTYYENVYIFQTSVSITGVAGATKTIVDGRARDSVFSIGDDLNVTLTGLTIQNGGMIYCQRDILRLFRPDLIPRESHLCPCKV